MARIGDEALLDLNVLGDRLYCFSREEKHEEEYENECRAGDYERHPEDGMHGLEFFLAVQEDDNDCIVRVDALITVAVVYSMACISSTDATKSIDVKRTELSSPIATMKNLVM